MSSPPASRELRPEIQALRALAVAVVVLHHTWPEVVPGGFVGVDVFFAISGFLITSHLVREVQRHGRISTGQFWARRARRILPAAFLVLLAATVTTLLFIGQNRWEQIFGEIRASALYFENWELRSTATDYFGAAGSVPSPVQHYWSLAVEEQFYLVWPVLLSGAAVLAARARRRVPLAVVLAVVMGTVAVASLVYSVVATGEDRAAAYFATPARVWEFAAGGLLALVPAWRGHDRVRAALSVLGLVLIAVACQVYSRHTAFPGIAAVLPIVGALAVIAAGAPGGRWSPTRALAWRPVQVIGDASYSLYLWHWFLLLTLAYTVDPLPDLAPALKVAAIAGAPPPAPRRAAAERSSAPSAATASR